MIKYLLTLLFFFASNLFAFETNITCLPILNIASFDCFCSLFIYMFVAIACLAGAAIFLKGH